MAEDLESSHGSIIEGRKMSEVFQVAEKRVDILLFSIVCSFSMQFKAYNMRDNYWNAFLPEEKAHVARCCH